MQVSFSSTSRKTIKGDGENPSCCQVLISIGVNVCCYTQNGTRLMMFIQSNEQQVELGGIYF